MSTRCCFKFSDDSCEVSVYKHYDGHPINAYQCILKAIPYAWPLPRYEAYDFAAAFIAANKMIGGGDIYVSSGVHCDLDYWYRVGVVACRGLTGIQSLHVEARRDNECGSIIYAGCLEEFGRLSKNME